MSDEPTRRDFQLVDGGEYLRRDGKTVQLVGPDSYGCMIDTLDGFSYDAEDFVNGHMVFVWKESDADLVGRVS